MEMDDRITTIQIRSSTRDRLYRMKYRKTYDDYICEMMDLIERLEKKGYKKPKDPRKFEAMIKASREWADRNVIWKDGKIVKVMVDGE